MNRKKEDKIEIMMIQLLFRSKPASPSVKQMRNALVKRSGDLGDLPCAQPSKESSGDMFMFPLPEHKVVLQDRPDGVPVMAAFLAADQESGIQLDDMKRSQLWDAENALEIINECRYTILVNTMLGAALAYKEQAEILLSQVDAALECYPDCIGIYAPQSGKLITPEMFEAYKEFTPAERFIHTFVNARFFNVTDSNEMIVDTLGFYVFGGADIQIHFKNMDPNKVVNYVYNISSYQFDNDFPIVSGDTIDSIDQAGKMCADIQWSVQYEDSLVQPTRIVLDINCGEYAGGNR
ncbi:MAG: DUF4261 domain-containing protein [Ruminococcus sp.]|nr:DUF4261 domain-containing protein [Ruminococcus sp.]